MTKRIPAGGPDALTAALVDRFGLAELEELQEAFDDAPRLARGAGGLAVRRTMSAEGGPWAVVSAALAAAVGAAQRLEAARAATTPPPPGVFSVYSAEGDQLPIPVRLVGAGDETTTVIPYGHAYEVPLLAPRLFAGDPRHPDGTPYRPDAEQVDG